MAEQIFDAKIEIIDVDSSIIDTSCIDKSALIKNSLYICED